MKTVLALGILAGMASGSENPMHVPADAVWNAPRNGVFYDRPLVLRQYGFGMLGSVVGGALLFYIGNAMEGAIFDDESQKGYLSFTGIRYDHLRGPFWGGGTGVLFGSALTVFFVGDADEEPGSVLWTLFGGALTSAAAFGLADLAGVQEEKGWLPFVPLLTLPPVGAVAGYQVSRWFNDRKRRKAVETAAGWQPPRLAWAPTARGLSLRLDALNFSF